MWLSVSGVWPMSTPEQKVSVADCLGEVRRANLRGRLLPQPQCPDRRARLAELEADGQVEYIGGGFGGWWAAPRG
jgi:hypothetical protein